LVELAFRLWLLFGFTQRIWGLKAPHVGEGRMVPRRGS